MPTPVLTVLVVEDDPHHREHYREALASDPALRLVAECSSVAQGKAALTHWQPDVLLVDLGLPDGSGFEVIAHASQTCPGTDTLVVSVFGGEANLLRAVQAGATGYLLKDMLPDDITQAIHALRQGESPISPPLARLLLSHCRASLPPSPTPMTPPPQAPEADALLSPREIRILELVALGLPFTDVAERLFISPHTVKTHVKNIYRKLQAHSRPHAVHLARQRGLLQA